MHRLAKSAKIEYADHDEEKLFLAHLYKLCQNTGRYPVDYDVFVRHRAAGQILDGMGGVYEEPDKKATDDDRMVSTWGWELPGIFGAELIALFGVPDHCQSLVDDVILSKKALEGVAEHVTAVITAKAQLRQEQGKVAAHERQIKGLQADQSADAVKIAELERLLTERRKIVKDLQHPERRAMRELKKAHKIELKDLNEQMEHLQATLHDVSERAQKLRERNRQQDQQVANAKAAATDAASRAHRFEKESDALKERIARMDEVKQ